MTTHKCPSPNCQSNAFKTVAYGAINLLTCEHGHVICIDHTTELQNIRNKIDEFEIRIFKHVVDNAVAIEFEIKKEIKKLKPEP